LVLACAACQVYDADLVMQERTARKPGSATGTNVFMHLCDVAADAACSDPQPEIDAQPSRTASDAASGSTASEGQVQPNAASEVDHCPDDPGKLAPGVCGCGVPDHDSDGDGTLDCADGCPLDPSKRVAGMCGCGHAETDRDGDGAADCVDDCPDDAHKTAPGACGCAASDPPGSQLTAADAVSCAHANLVHRYRFDGSGTQLSDSVGTAHGTIHGSRVQLGSGVLTFSGESARGANDGGWAEFPAQLWQGLHSASFELWVTWHGQGASGSTDWQRLFDFGDQLNGRGHSYLYLTPSGLGGVRTGFSLMGTDNGGEAFVTASAPLPLNVIKHVAVVVDQSAATLTLYVDGRSQSSVHMPGKLTDINAQNLWIGKSNFNADPALYGTLHEFRVYAVALSAEALAASFQAGPDAQ
jgi:hypothetical protein